MISDITEYIIEFNNHTTTPIHYQLLKVTGSK